MVLPVLRASLFRLYGTDHIARDIAETVVSPVRIGEFNEEAILRSHRDRGEVILHVPSADRLYPIEYMLLLMDAPSLFQVVCVIVKGIAVLISVGDKAGPAA